MTAVTLLVLLVASTAAYLLGLRHGRREALRLLGRGR